MDAGTYWSVQECGWAGGAPAHLWAAQRGAWEPADVGAETSAASGEVAAEVAVPQPRADSEAPVEA